MGLKSWSKRRQIDNLVLALGPKADQVLKSIGVEIDNEAATYTFVREKLQKFYEQQRNPVYDCCQLFNRVQRRDETVDSFINDLHILAENYEEIKAVKDFVIMIKLVSAMHDRELPQDLQRKQKLTLEAAIQATRTCESIRSEQTVMQARFEFQQVSNNKDFVQNGEPMEIETVKVDKSKKQMCQRCGWYIAQNHRCPAQDAEYHRCDKKEHFARSCLNAKKTQKKVREVTSDIEGDPEEDAELYMLPEVKNEKYGGSFRVECRLNGRERKMDFKIDTAAHVTMVSKRLAEQLTMSPTGIKLNSASNHPMKVCGESQVLLENGSKVIGATIYVCGGLKDSLLGGAGRFATANSP